MEAKEILKAILDHRFCENTKDGTVTFVVDKSYVDRAMACVAEPDVIQFNLYWIGGKTEVVSGASINDAFAKAGYGQGALRALDFYCKVGEGNYTYVDGSWKKD